MVQGHTNCDHDGGRLLDTTSSKPTEGLQWLRTVNFNECHNAGSHTLLCMLLHSSHLVKITLTPAQLLMLGVKKRKSSNLFNIIYTIKADRYVRYFWKETSCLGKYEFSRHRPSCVCLTQNNFQHIGNEEIFPFMPAMFTQWKWLPFHWQHCHCA